MSVIYLDHAASSWPKPPEVIKAMNDCILNYGANPGRGSHQLAVKASRMLFECRKNIAKLFNINNPNDISFTLNTTMALNQAIKGFIRPGQHVICTNVEHNSVRRPLEYLKNRGDIDVTYISVDQEGGIDSKQLEDAFLPHTRLFICNHSSNLLGAIMPIDQISSMCKEKGVRLLVDAAQSAGHIEIDVESMGIDMLAFPGHKGLLGPQGTGGLYIHADIDLEPIIVGGTGSQSEKIEQPTVRPDRYESGTPNTVGIAGLNAGVKHVLHETVASIHKREWELTQQLMDALGNISEIQLYGPQLGTSRTGIVALNIDGADSSEVAFLLDRNYQIAVRAGYHCTPLTHESIGTLNHGAVRISVGCFTTEHEIQQCVKALKELNQYFRKR